MVAAGGGHTRKAWVREHGGGRFVNRGSLGKPKDGDPRRAVGIRRTAGAGRDVTIRRSATSPSPPRSASLACPKSSPTSF
jgi:diadenosine tetraphosphatase ApaH/serine/threonine PP2A family protein phosphatase